MKTIEIKDLSASKVFCTAPWTHLHSFPDGNVIACCLSPATEVLGNLNNQSLEEIWNSDKLKKLRVDMLNGTPDANICGRCYTKEAEGFQSLRIGMNNKYMHSELDVVQSTKEDGTVEDFNLIHWDFRFSNLCNLSCRSCGPGLSSSWMKDHKKIWNIEGNPSALIKLPEDRNNILLEDVLKNIDKVKSIHFAGGEPMMMEEHWVILEELQKANRKDVQLHYSTNMTRFKFGKKHAFDYWHDFENVYVSASIDDIGQRFNYIRNGGDWDEVYQNLLDIKNQNFKNLTLAFHPTLSIFNINSFPDLVKLIWENDNFQSNIPAPHLQHYFVHVVNLNPLTYPDIYSMTILPEEEKKKAAKGIEDLIQWVHDTMPAKPGYPINVDPLKSLIDFLYANDNSHLLQNFLGYTENLDKFRDQDFFATFPELESLKKYG